VINPAFSRYHPRMNVVYTCTEDIENNGQIFAYCIGPSGELTEIGSVDAGGTSTCYITLSKDQRFLLAVNYWDSTLAVIPLSTETGEFIGPIQHMYDPRGGKEMVAAGRCHGGVNHSNNDDSTIRMRQADPHSHALVLDPFVGTVAYVPDLGKDLIREFYFDRKNGKIGMEMNVLPSGLCTGKPDGPRYFSFHPKYNIGYVVNELSSTIAVFEVDRDLLREIAAASDRQEDMSRFKGRSTLRLIQSVKTIPSAFPTLMNTCGRICVHKSGRFVVVSNRGHQSIAIFRVFTKGPKRGELSAVGYFHTRGETPRHFQFDQSGQYLIVANQDSDSIAVFNFNLSSGEIKYTGNEYRVPSPNFVCCCPMYGDDDDDMPTEAATTQVSSVPRMTEPEEESCESDLSCTVPFSVNTKEGKLDELSLARLEIAELKQQISSMMLK
jgi:6-phosphogluconolactonase